MTRTLALASILVLLCGLGCSSFKSSSSPSRWSGQSSKASSSPSRWSSQSSGGGQEAPGDSTAYEKDVQAAATEAARAGAGGHEVMRRVGIVAADHGITDWEGNPATYRAIGVGLASGGLPVNDFEQVSRDVSAGSETRSKLLLEGYSSSP